MNIKESTVILSKIMTKCDEIKIIVTNVDGQTIMIENTNC